MATNKNIISLVNSLGQLLAGWRFAQYSQQVTAPDEVILNKQIVNAYRRSNEAINKEDIAKSIVLTTTLRKNITSVKLLPDSSLECVFENGVQLLFTTDTEVVDWHWAITEQPKDPYMGCVIGCFNPSEVQVGNC